MKHALLTTLLGITLCTVSTAADFATETLNATYKLFHPDSTGTCFFVKRDAPDSAIYLVSAAHTLERTKGDTAIVVLREILADGTHQRHDHTIPIRRDGTDLWTKHEKEDVAVLKLPAETPVPVATLPLSTLADEAALSASALHICSPLFVLTYPQRFEANAAGFAVARQGIIASHPFLPVSKHPTFLADFTTFAGDSGGPVFVPGADDHPF